MFETVALPWLLVHGGLFVALFAVRSLRKLIGA